MQIQKEAQKRSILNKIRESTNIGGIATEQFFDPEFKRIMDQLRDETDDPIRAIVTGQQIGNATPSDNVSMKELLKSARSNFNRREYMSSIADLGKFHRKMADIRELIVNFVGNVDAVHHQFLFKDLDPDTEKYLREELRSRFAQEFTINLFKTAGIMDFFKNISTERGRALKAWEKRYPKRVAELKKAIDSLINKSEMLLTAVLSSLKKMATSRATRKVDEYINNASVIVNKYTDYDKNFKQFYDSQVKGFLEKQELLSPTKPVDKSSDIAQQEIGKPTEPPKNKPESIEVVTPKVEPISTPSAPIIPPTPTLVPVTPAVVPSTTGPSAAVPSSVSTVPATLSLTEKIMQSLTGVAPKPKPKEVENLPAVTVPPLSPELESAISGKSEVKPGKPLYPEVIPSSTPPAGGVPYEQGPFGAKPLKPPSVKAEHKKFFDSLEKMSNENPIILAKYIAKYAKMIQTTDPYTALELFNVVKSIRG